MQLLKVLETVPSTRGGGDVVSAQPQVQCQKKRNRPECPKQGRESQVVRMWEGLPASDPSPKLSGWYSICEGEGKTLAGKRLNSLVILLEMCRVASLLSPGRVVGLEMRTNSIIWTCFPGQTFTNAR